MLTYHQWGLVAFTFGQFHRKCSWDMYLIYLYEFENYQVKITAISPVICSINGLALFGAKPSPEPALFYWPLEPLKQTSVKLEWKKKHIFLHEKNAFQNVTCKMLAILFRKNYLQRDLTYRGIVIPTISHFICLQNDGHLTQGSMHYYARLLGKDLSETGLAFLVRKVENYYMILLLFDMSSLTVFTDI